MSKIAEKLKDQLNYRPSDIIINMKHKLGIEISYSKALHAPDAALVLNNRTHEDAYKNVPQYCQDLEAADLKTKALVERMAENKFQCLFSVTAYVQSDLHIVILFLISIELI